MTLENLTWDADAVAKWGAAGRWGVPDDVPIALVILDSAGNVVDRNRIADDLLYDGSHGLLRVGAPFMTLVSHSVRQYARWRARGVDTPLDVRLRVGSQLIPVVLVQNRIQGDEQHTMLAIFMRDGASHVDAHQLAFDAATNGMFVTDASGRLLVANPSLLEILQAEAEEVVGESWQRIFFTQAPEVTAGVHNELLETGEWRGRVIKAVQGHGDRLLELTFRLRAPKGAGGESGEDVIARSTVGEVVDVTEGRSVELALREQARRDELTGLFNRTGFMGVLDERFAAAERNGSELTLLYLDLDNFKTLNDNFGHRYGDLLLEAFAGRLRGSLKSTDVIGRLGGDEFAVLFDPGLPPETLASVVNKLRDRLLQEYQLDELSYMCSASFGSAEYPWDAASRNELVEYADHAMYQAKASGRNTHARFDRRVFRDWAAHEDVIAAVSAAIDNSQVIPYYQPIYSAFSGEILGAEALVRWVEPDELGGVHLPEVFLPLIDGNAVGIRMTVTMIDRILEDLRVFSGSCPSISVAVNLSMAQLRADDVVAHIERRAASHPDEIERLRIELTEGSLASEDPIVAQNIARIAAAGAVLSLSGFGTGQASILSLRAYEFGQLKLDRRVLASMTADPADRVVTESLIELCRKLGIETVTEGIETDAQLSYVRRLGCDLAQGYLLARPMPVEAFRRLLEENCPFRSAPLDPPAG